jgi:RNA polymerase sigma factor (sigma-70 family)
MIRKMIRNYGGNAQDAEDVFQESLIILCRKTSETDFTLTARLSTYLFSVCRFLWKDESKKRNRNIPFPDEGLPEEAVSGTPGSDRQQDLNTAIEKAVEEEAQFRLAEKVFRGLGARCRELLLLFYKKGQKLSEIASKMGYNSENSAKNQKYKCLENARNNLKELQQTIQTL